MSKSKFEMFQMVDYNHVTEIASFSFMNDKQLMRILQISRTVFKELMVNKDWDIDRYGQIQSEQYQFKNCLLNNSEKNEDWMKWFDDKANNIIKKKMSNKK